MENCWGWQSLDTEKSNKCLRDWERAIQPLFQSGCLPLMDRRLLSNEVMQFFLFIMSPDVTGRKRSLREDTVF